MRHSPRPLRAVFGLFLNPAAIIAALLSVFAATQLTAQEQRVLVVNVHGPAYDDLGVALSGLVQQAGADMTFVNLDTVGAVSESIRTNTFDQIWVFDLSHDVDDYPADWLAIANWFKTDTTRAIICDARICSSLWNGRAATEGGSLVTNYYANLKLGRGGLMLGTDHNEYHSGINSINEHLGLIPFSGLFNAGTIPVDQENPIMNSPIPLGAELPDDSSTGLVPYGLQPNGLFLYPVAWHGGDSLSPGISTTIPSAARIRVVIQSPADATVVPAGSSVTLTAVASEGEAPYQYLWTSSLQGALPSGASSTIANITAGEHLITVTALDSANRIAAATVRITAEAPANNLKANIATAVEIWWDAALGKTYQVQWSSEAQPAVWQDLGSPIPGVAGALSVFDSTRQNGKRFYRIVEQP